MMSKLIGVAVAVLVVVSVDIRAHTPSHGDGFLYLGDSGHAYLEDSDTADLDYSQSFTIEVVGRIEPHQPGARWATFLEKGGDLVLRRSTSPGYGLGTYTGNFETFSQRILAKVGDGVTDVSIESPRGYQGYVHVVVTWEMGPRTMTLYINGEQIDSKTDSSLLPNLIKNSGELRMGKGYQELRRNVFLARLWNRSLSASEIARVSNAFVASKRHTLPPEFDRSGLVSEWLMDQTCDAAGNYGVTHLKDHVGRNHLRLAGNARLVSGDGPVTVVYPPDSANAVAKSVVLRVSGGGLELGGPFARPLHYEFQIDESPTFDSPALKQSGWIAHYGEWKPVLKPSTQYFWRVKVRDSGTPPAESSYSKICRFRTEGPSTWYVRPLTERDGREDDLGNPVVDEGIYGSQDGTSYENAFNGIANIRWGEHGVEAGDTLYVCDTHVYHSYKSYWAPPTVGYIKEPGFSLQCPITIRMDYAGAKGVLCGFFVDMQEDVQWTGPDENSVYHTSDLPHGAAVEFNGSDYIWLEREEQASWEGHFAAVYNAPREDEPWLVQTTYIKTSDGRHPEGRVYGPDLGFGFDLGRSSYIRFEKCDFFNSVVAANSNQDTISELPPSRYIVFEDCRVGYHSSTLIDLAEGMDNWVIRGCELGYGGKGVHVWSAHNLLVEQCDIHDIGAPNFPDGDAHAIGVQNGSGHIFQNNHIWTVAGSAVEFWSSRNTMQDMTVRYNFIHDTLGLAKTSASAIVISGGQRATPGKRTGFRIHNNIIMNTAGGDESWKGYGISSNSMDSVEIYNNVLYNTYHGIRLVTVTPEPGFPVQARVCNNMIIRPKGLFAYVVGAPERWDEFYWDHNLYYPATDTETRFHFGQDVRRDDHSLLADPRFVAADPDRPEDFKLQVGSPAIDAGMDVGLTEDPAGVSIPQGRAPDIGVFEYAK